MLSESEKKVQCESCGKSLPVRIVSVDGEVIISVRCRICKHRTVIKLKDGQ